MPTFSVTAMMREDPEVVERFVAFYRAAGAERIYVYFDGSVAELDGLDLSGVELTECDDAFWQALCGGRPADLDGALQATHMLSAERHGSDWLFVSDADEFLTGGSVSGMLAGVPDDVDVLRVRNVEAVWGPGDDATRPFGCTHFRKPLSPRQSRLVSGLLYGRLAAFFRNGLVGHSNGKQFIRRGARFTEIRSHNTWQGDTPLGRWAHEVMPHMESMVVLHYDAVSFERWREKWRRRFSKEMPSSTMAPKRAAQMPRIKAAISAGDAQARALFRRFYGLNGWQRAVLRLIGRLERHDIFGVRAAPPPRD